MFVVSKTGQHGVSHISAQLYEPHMRGPHANILAFQPFVLFFSGELMGRKQESTEAVTHWWCDEGMRECLVSHNSAKLEVNCCFLRPGLFFSFGAALYETRFHGVIELFILFVFAVDVPSLISPLCLF